ncbi:MAG: hypothetical protein ACK5DG_04370 [Chitinophagaceae bacterium]|jgi:signal recognition particle subunit SEC65
MNLRRRNNSKVVAFLILSLIIYKSNAQSKFDQHKTVVILPAFYFDKADTNKLNIESQKLKLIGFYKKEIGIDVQYKFYLPLMLKQEKYSTFFRGVDTINNIINGKEISFNQYDDLKFKQLDSIFNVDAFIILELSETNTYYKGTNSTIISTLLFPSPGLIGKAIDANTIRQALTNQTVGLTLTAKIYDCSNGKYLWQTSASVVNKYYHNAVNQLVNIIHKRLPYNKRRNN